MSNVVSCWKNPALEYLCWFCGDLYGGWLSGYSPTKPSVQVWEKERYSWRFLNSLIAAIIWHWLQAGSKLLARSTAAKAIRTFLAVHKLNPCLSILLSSVTAFSFLPFFFFKSRWVFISFFSICALWHIYNTPRLVEVTWAGLRAL